MKKTKEGDWPVSAVAEVQREIDYWFRDSSLEALTHSSDPNHASYDRLAFVGDAALNLAVTNCLHGAHPDLGPGELTALRSANVSTEKFARAVVRHGLYRYVRCNAEALNRAVEEFSDAVTREDETAGWMSYGGSSKKAPKVLADVVEAIAGAVYIDSDLNLDKLWEVFEGILEPIITSKTLDEQPVTSLYKLCQKHGKSVQFTKKSVQFTNFPKGSTNTIKVFADGKLIGSCSSEHKQIAKLNAARDALQHLSNSGLLNAAQDALQHLSISESDEPKQIAKLNAAARDALQPLSVSESDNNTDTKELKKGAKSRLNELCSKRHWHQPKYRVEREQGPPHNKRFTCLVNVQTSDNKVATTAIGGEEKPTIKEAENEAAYEMLRALV